MISSIRTFLRLESASGILLVLAAALAMLCANTGVKHLYESLLQIPAGVQFGEFQIQKPLLLWINDGLMVLFFFVVGMELKRELLEGELSDLANVGLPALGALGGMVVPGFIYWWVNHDNPAGMAGWAIPIATDTAFSLGILSLLGQRVPLSLKVFLVSLAIFDDVGAILIIAFFFFCASLCSHDVDRGPLSCGALLPEPQWRDGHPPLCLGRSRDVDCGVTVGRARHFSRCSSRDVYSPHG